jgi:hypothetical protein
MILRRIIIRLLKLNPFDSLPRDSRSSTNSRVHIQQWMVTSRLARYIAKQKRDETKFEGSHLVPSCPSSSIVGVTTRLDEWATTFSFPIPKSKDVGSTGPKFSIRGGMQGCLRKMVWHSKHNTSWDGELSMSLNNDKSFSSDIVSWVVSSSLVGGAWRLQNATVRVAQIFGCTKTTTSKHSDELVLRSARITCVSYWIQMRWIT